MSIEPLLLSNEEILIMTDEERARYESFLRRELYRLDPVLWGQRRLKELWWSKQIDIANSVATHRMTAVKSCHDVGKSFIASRLVSWWIDTHEPGEAFVVTSAPTFQQVRAILWREIGKAHRKGELIGRVNLTEWFIGTQLVGFGRKPSDADPTSFQGIHAKYVLIVLDEACGIPQTLWDAASTLITNANSRILAIGNPDDPGSHFAQICKPDSGWNVIHISAFDSPNFTGEEVAKGVGDSLIGPLWVQEKQSEWGEGSPLYVSKVLGEFPVDNTDGIVPYSWVRACQHNLAVESEPVELGVDVGAGGDESVIWERRGPKAIRCWRSRHDDAMRGVGEIVNVARETGATSIKIDVIGVGFGIAGRLIELHNDGTLEAQVVPVNVGERSSAPSRFKNLKAEIWWDVCRELSRSGGWDLTDVDDQTIAELIAHRYRTDSAGRTQVESKDEVKSRLGRSPDNADALALAFYTPADTAVFLGSA